jgi:GNAT superfamily N-acetyltransferase
MNTHPIAIRRSKAADLPLLVAFLRHMLTDMAAAGGHPIAADREPWSDIEAAFRDHQDDPGYLHLLATTGAPDSAAVGWAFARSTSLDPLFVPTRMLHIHALYVSPPYRRQGIGRALLNELLSWGRSVGCTAAELNVLVGNPARFLYQELGFHEFEIEMTRKL